MKEFEVEISTVECPVCDIACPYCDMAGYCHIRDPMRECDDYFACYGEAEEDE